MAVQYLQGLANWLLPQAGMFMWMKLEGGVKDADEIIDALKEEQVAVVPGFAPNTRHPVLPPVLPPLCILSCASQGPGCFSGFRFSSMCVADHGKQEVLTIAAR